MKTSVNGLRLIQEFEGFSSKPYKCSAGVWTIGYGSTYYPSGVRVTAKDAPITMDYAEIVQKNVIAKDYEPIINSLLKSAIDSGFVNQNMYDAMISLVYNIGADGFKRSSVLRHLKNGDKLKAADAFLLWDKAGGKVLKGLTRRREKERKLFLS